MKTSFKKYIFIAFLIWTSNIYSQLTVDAGRDTFLCFNSFESFVLGGKPTAKNGIEPYKYKWTYIARDKEHNIYELHGTLIENDTLPNITYEAVDLDLYIKFFIHVTDNNNNEATDSVLITTSAIKITHPILYAPTIAKGEKCQLQPLGIYNGFPPLKYKWTPEYNISDPTIAEPFAWPDTSTTYFVEVTDSLGCKGHYHNDVYVIATDVKEKLIIPNYEITPNPITQRSVIKFGLTFTTARLKVYNSNGVNIFSNPIHTNVFEIGRIIKSPGTYFFTLEKNNTIISKGIFISNFIPENSHKFKF